MTSRRLTIFEGPDGAGKTTAAVAFAEATGAVYQHFGPLKNIRQTMPRLMVEAMLPALLGHQDVVLDRCWLSDRPYGEVYRGGLDRVGVASGRMLERLALRCAATVMLCMPPWETARDNFLGRLDDEFLDNEAQLRHVYDHYAKLTTALPLTRYDYTQGPLQYSTIRSSRAHRLSTRSAGNLDAPVLVIGEAFAELQERDPLYQWPFASFSDKGCSAWFTRQLEEAGVPEDQLLWVNADQPLPSTVSIDTKAVALGRAAEAYAKRHGLFSAEVYQHPQAWKRFNSHKDYPAIEAIRRLSCS